jgi:hypothetical protein
MVFFEILYQFTADVIRLAFEGDPSVQELAVDETNKLFRSKTFLFHSQNRSDMLSRATKVLDEKSKNVLENTSQLAELLVPKEAKLIMKHANQQRTPFLACQLPGGTNYLKFQRVRRGGGATVPTAAEQMYKVEMTSCPFPPDHRALALPASAQPSVTVASPHADGKPLPLTPSDISRVVAASPDVEASVSSLASRNHSNGRLRPQTRGGGPSPTSSDVSVNAHSTSAADDLTEFERFLVRPAIEWLMTDMFEEISAIYQALANGVVVSNFSVPLDLKLRYDPSGMLILDSLPNV